MHKPATKTMKRDRVSLDNALRDTIEQMVARQLRLAGGRPLEQELRELRSSVARHERRIESLDAKLGSRPRRTGRTGSPGRPPLHEGCKVEGCTNEHYALGLCSKHYQQERRAKLERQSKSQHRRRPRARKVARA